MSSRAPQKFKKQKVGFYGRDANQKYVDELCEGDVIDWGGERLTVTYRSSEIVDSFVIGNTLHEIYLLDGVFGDGTKLSESHSVGDLFTVLERNKS